MDTVNQLIKMWEMDNKSTPRDDQSKKSERRHFSRLVYPSNQRATFIVGMHKLEIINISERGLKLKNNPKIQIHKKVHGTILFLSGETLDLVGQVIWQSYEDTSLLIDSIPRSFLIRELRDLLQKQGYKRPKGN